MSKYDDEIFKTLTIDEENFSSAFEIYQHMGAVVDKMVSKFWYAVKRELEELTKDTDFKVEIYENNFAHNSKLYLYLEPNKDFRFTYEHLGQNQNIGLWANTFQDKVNIEKTNAYKMSVRKNFDGWEHTTSNEWIAYKSTGEDFSKLSSLIKILPNNIEDYPRIKAQELFDFAEEYKQHLQHLVTYCSNE
ncbi:hypothetical protein [Aequorivita antarctica]|uniref:Uncharacterized protein n=1 Tax=Aequorivita antarctica TaxID=153266 RepID=A0A5C6Z1K3_9FLAO|nr:hypothetical protein [Aequorivita antarctica]TXD73908.1 hypothetical protein ESU54_05410 [Aequorivita antarctica]SRX73373.1 hypothetical protein AEQU3_00809 [Aequorivita antarctica]